MQIFDVKSLGKLIKETRKEQQLTQADLAVSAQVGVRFIVDLENGKETDKIGNNMIAVSIPGSNLWKRSEKENWCNRYPMDEATGGRTSVCSAAGQRHGIGDNDGHPEEIRRQMIHTLKGPSQNLVL